MPRKQRREKAEKWTDDEEEREGKRGDEEEETEEDAETIDLDSAEEEEDDEDEEDAEDEEEDAESVEDMERKRLFQTEAEEILEHLSVDDFKEVLKENDMDTGLAHRLRKTLTEVVGKGDAGSMDEAWEEALTRLEEEE